MGSQGAGPEKVHEAQSWGAAIRVVGLQGPFSASAGGPGKFTHVPLKVPEGMAGLASDLSVISDPRGTEPESVWEYLQIKMTLEPRTKP